MLQLPAFPPPCDDSLPRYSYGLLAPGLLQGNPRSSPPFHDAFRITLFPVLCPSQGLSRSTRHHTPLRLALRQSFLPDTIPDTTAADAPLRLVSSFPECSVPPALIQAESDAVHNPPRRCRTTWVLRCRSHGNWHALPPGSSPLLLRWPTAQRSRSVPRSR